MLRLLVKVLAGLVAALALATAVWALLPARTAPITGANAIAALERLELGGVEQTVLIRGTDRENPVLLYLHGGPGFAMLPAAPYWSGDLEKHFVVVHWDQRGAGASCTPDVPPASLTTEQIVTDTLELSRQLADRFGGGDRIYLLGHSWGSVVGTLAVQRRPDLFHAYIGLGQVVDVRRNEEISYRFTLREAERRGDEDALADLSAIHPPYADIEQLETQRVWLMRYRGSLYDREAALPVLWRALFGREYTLGTRLRFLGCFRESLRRLWPELQETDFFTSVPRLEVPVYLLVGREDWNTPFELSAQWAERLEAPRVETIWLEGVGHMAPVEDPAAFQRALIDRVLADTPPNG